MYSGFLNQTLCLWYKRGLVQILVGSHQWKVFICKWHRLFMGYMHLWRETHGKWPLTETKVNDKWFFFGLLGKSKRQGAWQLNMPHSACTKFAEHLLRFRSYTCQLLQCVTARDILFGCFSELYNRLKNKIVPSYEATLHISRHVNRCNFRILRTTICMEWLQL